MQIEQWKVLDLIPYEKNPRKNDHAVEKVAIAIKKFGFRVPILIKSDGSIIDGHLRYKAAIYAGIKDVPCLLADDMSDAQIKAFRISVNKVAELAQWDRDLLEHELVSLRDLDFDLSSIGYEEFELNEIMGDDQPQLRQDDIPPIPARSVSRPGDLWICGNHRILCGDATSIDVLSMLMGEGQADMVFTDPPYNVDYNGNAGKIKNDKMSALAFDEFLKKSFSAMAAVLRPGGPIYISHADYDSLGIAFRSAFLAAGFHLAACLIWMKNQFTLGRSDYQWIHEPILYGWKKGAAHKWFGGRKKRTIQKFPGNIFVMISENEYQISIGDEILTITGKDIEVRSDWPTIITEDKPQRSDMHPTMKPVALIERFIKNSSSPGDIVLDPFGGSGTTMIAAEKTGRHAYLTELDEKFVDVIVTRWEEFVSGTAYLSGDGRSFAEIAGERE